MMPNALAVWSTSAKNGISCSARRFSSRDGLAAAADLHLERGDTFDELVFGFCRQILPEYDLRRFLTRYQFIEINRHGTLPY